MSDSTDPAPPPSCVDTDKLQLKALGESSMRGPVTLNEWRDEVYTVAKNNGFHSFTSVPVLGNFIANLHSEVTELWEAYRAGTLNERCDKAAKMEEHGVEAMTCAEEELADIIIRALDTAHVLGIDVDSAVTRKNAFNKTRSYRHGNKRA